MWLLAVTFFLPWILLWFLSSVSFRIPSPSLLNYSLQTIKIYQLELTDTVSKWRVKCWFIKEVFTSPPFTHSTCPPAQSGAGLCRTPPMTADNGRRRCNALVKETNATPGCAQEGVSRCEELTPCTRNSYRLLWGGLDNSAPQIRSRTLTQVQRRTSKTRGKRAGSQVKGEITAVNGQFNMGNTSERKNICATGDCWYWSKRYKFGLEIRRFLIIRAKMLWNGLSVRAVCKIIQLLVR